MIKGFKKLKAVFSGHSDHPLADVDGNPMAFKNRLGVLPLRDALRKLRPEEVEREEVPEAALPVESVKSGD